MEDYRSCQHVVAKFAPAVDGDEKMGDGKHPGNHLRRLAKNLEEAEQRNDNELESEWNKGSRPFKKVQFF